MSGTLPTWMEHWFGLSNGPGMGIAWRLEYRWPWPPWVTLLGIVALVVAITGIYLREARQAGRGYRLVLAAVRLLAIGLVLLMIAQIELLLQRTGLPFVVVIIDDTRSMGIVDHYDEDVRKSLEDRVARVLKQAAGQRCVDHEHAIAGQSRRVRRPRSFPAGMSPACSSPRTTAACCLPWPTTTSCVSIT